MGTPVAYVDAALPALERGAIIDLWSRNLSWLMAQCHNTAWAHLPGSKDRWADRSGDPEGPLECLWSLGAWFSKPDRCERLQTSDGVLDLTDLFATWLGDGLDAESPSHWNPHQGDGWLYASLSANVVWSRLLGARAFDQPTLEQIDCMLAQWLDLMPPPDEREISEIGTALLEGACRSQLGLNVDLESMDEMWHYMTDGASPLPDDLTTSGTAHLDDEGLWHAAWPLLMAAPLLQERHPGATALACNHLHPLLKLQPQLFAANGGHIEFGTGNCYKFGRLAPLVLTYHFGHSPCLVGVLRRLVRRHIASFMVQGALNPQTGALLQENAEGGSLALREHAISPGSVFRCHHLFAALWLLDDDDPLWSVAEEPLPSETQTKIINLQHNRVLAHDGKGGAVLHSLASPNLPLGEDHFCAKYGKSHYSAAHGCISGLMNRTDWVTPDGTLLIRAIGGHWIHRGDLMETDTLADGTLWCRYHLSEEGGWGARIEEWACIDPRWVLRVWRIIPDRGAGHVEFRAGSTSIGHHSDDEVEYCLDHDCAWVMGPGGCSVIRAIAGFQRLSADTGFEGIEAGHNRHPRFALAVAEGAVAQSERPLLAIASAHSLNPQANPLDLLPTIEVIDAETHTLAIEGKSWRPQTPEGRTRIET